MLQRTPPVRPPAGLLPTLAFANFAIGIGAFGVIGVITPISSGLGLTHSQAGMVMSIYALAYAIGSPLAITATGRLDRRSVILTGMGLFFIASLLCALAPNAEALLAGRALAALGAGMVTPVGAAIAVAQASPERRGAALSFVFMGMTVAQAGGIPIGSYLGVRGDRVADLLERLGHGPFPRQAFADLVRDLKKAAGAGRWILESLQGSSGA